MARKPLTPSVKFGGLTGTFVYKLVTQLTEGKWKMDVSNLKIDFVAIENLCNLCHKLHEKLLFRSTITMQK